MIREKVAHALTARNLQPSSETETAIDVIGAMGTMSRFASLLYRLKYGDEMTRRNQQGAEAILTRKLQSCQRVQPSSITRRIARLALREWLFDRCDVCQGRRTLGGRCEVTVTRRRACKACRAKGWVQRITPQGTTLIDACSHCRGRGFVSTSHVLIDEPSRLCHACSGTGRLAISDVDRACILGISADEARTLRKQIDYALDVLRRVDVMAARLLKQQLADS